jgi:hypothetical protein
MTSPVEGILMRNGVIEMKTEAGDAGRVHQRHHAVLAAPGIVRLRCIGEAKAQDTVAGDAAIGQDGERLARLRRGS